MVSEKIAKILKDYLFEMGRRGGKKAAANMTPEQRKARAKKASDAATAKRKARKDPA